MFAPKHIEGPNQWETTKGGKPRHITHKSHLGTEVKLTAAGVVYKDGKKVGKAADPYTLDRLLRQGEGCLVRVPGKSFFVAGRGAA